MSLHAPGVSIVMAARNAMDSIAAAVESLCAQTFRDWELLLALDRCHDGTEAVVRRVARRDRRIRPFTASPGGLVPALNAALDRARGRFIARMDADDVCHPERLDAELELLERKPALDIASCLVEFGGDRRRAAGYARHVDWLNTLVTPEEIVRNRFVESPLANPSVLFRRELLDRVGLYRDGPFPEDYEFWLRCFETGARAAKVPRCLFTWNDPSKRLTRHDPRYLPEAFHRVKAPFLARAIERVRRGRPVWFWGAGRVTRRRSAALETEGIVPAGYLDVDPRKAHAGRLPRPVILPAELPAPSRAFVVSWVSKRGAREQIRAHLQTAGFQEGEDFLLAA